MGGQAQTRQAFLDPVLAKDVVGPFNRPVRDHNSPTSPAPAPLQRRETWAVGHKHKGSAVSVATCRVS